MDEGNEQKQSSKIKSVTKVEVLIAVLAIAYVLAALVIKELYSRSAGDAILAAGFILIIAFYSILAEIRKGCYRQGRRRA